MKSQKSECQKPDAAGAKRMRRHAQNRIPKRLVESKID